MAFTPEDKAAEILEQVIAQINKKFPPQQAQQIEIFVQHFYHYVAPGDVLDRGSVSDLYGAAVDYWHFARQFMPCQAQDVISAPKVRVYNPQFERDGWQSSHTVISVLTRDMPFLVDSIRMTVNRLGLTVHLIIHPVVHIQRDAEGQLLDIMPPQYVDVETHASELSAPSDADTQANYETLIHVEVDHQTETTLLDSIKTELEAVLRDVRLAVSDWQAQRDRLEHIVAELENHPPPLEDAEVMEVRKFLKWLNADHFTFLGFREYAVEGEGEDQVLRIVPNSSLGVLRKIESPISRSFAELSGQLKQIALKPELLLLTKTNTRATVHRPVYMDYVGIKKINADKQVVGEWRFLGLYTSAAYHMTTLEIPVLRRKVNYVLESAGYRRHSHQSKALFNILESYPRDEIFQIDVDTLYSNTLGILQLQERQRVRLFVRPDPFGRFIACIVYAPRDHYDTEIRKRMQDVLLRAFEGDSIEFNVQLSESVLAQVYFIVHTPLPELPAYDLREIESRLIEVTRAWTDNLYDTLVEQRGEEQGTNLFRHYQEAFPVAYREDFNARYAVFDIDKLESLEANNGLSMSLYKPLEALDNSLRFKLFHQHDHIPLSKILPMLENMGVQVISERAYHIKPTNQQPLWIQEFELRYTEQVALEIGQLNAAFQAVFARVWREELDNDGFNRLVLRSGLQWRDIVVFRAYCRYLRQTGRSLSQVYMQNTLANHPDIAQKLLALFHARCNPAQQNDSSAQQVEKLQADIEALLDSVASLDEDRILRQFLSVILATLRTNYFQTDAHGQPKSYVSFKFDPQQMPYLPEPRPMFEIFVYSPRMEGVHLRGGKVARGGLRWSDRYEDFRTEVLGLVKAQIVKNAVIVPVGSKGGFVAKRLPTEQGRDAMQAEGIECYKTFIRGLLDVTDNLQEGQIVPPPQVVRHDDDDPYLVVAADKGTATFSDIANGVAQEYQFWLGDAFASGGSAGYDHKKMGITARGAWESVKRHFRELGLDTQQQSFTAVGIGDMSGDVFGNGLMLSPCIKLIGGFNHLHIFVDPDPDPAASFAERQRLFKLPRSTWMDYEPELISAGGGVFSRKSKSIMITPEMRQVLGINNYTLSPNELISALLKAPVDLIWNGGIGTYVKACNEHHSEVGDRANDAVRVDGQDLRCRVVGEGGNLGFTQLGRIEYARQGGRINTDAIDNAGGVNCSDHEVNIKILLNSIVNNGDMTAKQRNQLLADMTDRVAHLVIRDNYLQTQALSISVFLAPQLLSAHTRLLHQLEREGRLDRALEFLPTDKAIAERSANNAGFSAPEISVLLAYSKITLYENLLVSDVPEDPYLAKILLNYFPEPLPSRFATELHQHRLRREIIATDLTNTVVNRAGSTFIFVLGEETSQPPPNVARAFIAAWDIFDMQSLWRDIEALDNQISAQVQIQMMVEARKLIERASRWLLRNGKTPLPIAETVETFHPGVMQLLDKLMELVSAPDQDTMQSVAENWLEQGVPAALATRITCLVTWLSALDIVDVTQGTERPLEMVAGVHFLLGTRLKLHWLRDHISALPRDDRWKALSRFTLREELYNTHRELTRAIMQMCVESTDPETHFEMWLQEKEACVNRCQEVLSELSSIAKPDLSMLSVAVREVRHLL